MLLEKDENSDVCGNVRLLLVGPFFRPNFRSILGIFR